MKFEEDKKEFEMLKITFPAGILGIRHAGDEIVYLEKHINQNLKLLDNYIAEKSMNHEVRSKIRQVIRKIFGEELLK